MTQPTTTRRAGPRLVAVGLPWLLCTACSNPFGLLDDKSIGPRLESLHEIDTIRLEEHSRSEPVTVEDAAEEAIEELQQQPAPPAEVKVGLADVRAASLANNLDLKVQLVNPSIADATVSEEEAKFEATFFGSARYTRTDQPVEFETQSAQAEISTFDVGLDLPLITGGNVIVDMPFGRSDTDNPFSLLNPAFDAAVRFSITQPLLRGGGIRANTHSIRVAQGERKIVTAQTKLEAIRILANADRAYWLLYAAQMQLAVRRQQYDLAIEQLEQARRKFQAGDVPEIEVTRAESGVASRLEDIIVAEMLLRRRRRNLKQILNRDDLPIASETALVLDTHPNPMYLDLDPIALGEYALANRMEMLELELRLVIDAGQIDFEKNNALPLFTVDYTYSVQGRDTSWGGAYDQIGDRSFTDWTIGVNGEIPIGNEAAKARVHRAVLTRLQRLATRDQRRQAILQEVYDAVDLLNQEWQRIIAARQAVILAGRTYEGEKRQFEVGLRTSTDVLDAAARLADAQSSEVRAVTDHEIARVDIAFSTGTLLGHGRVLWEPADN